LAVAGGADNRDDLERQRAEIDADFRAGWVPGDAGAPRVLTETAFAEGRKIVDEGGWTGLDRATIEAVRDGAQPGDLLPPLVRRPFIDRVASDAEVIIVSGGSGQNVAVLFSHEHFPEVRFGHRFPPMSEDGARYASIWLKEEIETGALHRMMQDSHPAHNAGIIWTTWGASGHEYP
jgi:hypothetical protein